MSKRLLTIPELAERWGTSVRHVREMRYRGEIPAIKIAGLVRFDPDDVAEYESSHRNSPRVAS